MLVFSNDSSLVFLIDFGELSKGSQYFWVPSVEDKRPSQGGAICNWIDLTSLDFLCIRLKSSAQVITVKQVCLVHSLGLRFCFLSKYFLLLHRRYRLFSLQEFPSFFLKGEGGHGVFWLLVLGFFLIFGLIVIQVFERATNLTVNFSFKISHAFKLL